MKILVTGGTGFIGSAVCDRLIAEQHEIVVLTRNPSALKPIYQGLSSIDKLKNDESFDVVINLAGEPIADKRWSAQQKQRIINSRVKTTEQLIDYFSRCDKKPSVFVSGSAVGYYGVAASNEAIDEAGSPDNSFSSELCQKWEQTALKAEQWGVRTCLIRTGIVLGDGGGALSKMLPIFKLGLGGKIGHGGQWMPWIHLEDMVAIIIYCINHSQISGAINATAPLPVSNQAFSQALGDALQRPSFMPMPATAVKILMGQMGQELLLSGKKIVPAKLLNHGFVFNYPKLPKALERIVS